MICRGICITALLGAGALSGWSADAAPGQFDSLIKSSPFGQAAPAGVQAGGGPSALEFRGVVMDQGEYLFSLHETAARSNQWVGLKETGQPYTVESYDQTKGTIQVKYRGQAQTLSLKQAQIIVQAATAGPPLPTNVVGGPANGNQPNLAPGAATDEASRLALVAEEIRRRRALRTPPGQLPQPSPSTGQVRAGAMIQPNAPENPSRPYIPPAKQ